MLLRYYFLMKGPRVVFDEIELMTYLNNKKYITRDQNSTIKRGIYHNPVLDFEASFVLGPRTIINNIERLNPEYLDTKFYLEFDLATNSYKISKLFDIVKEICYKFDFAIYNDLFQDVMEFNKGKCMNALTYAKKVYQQNYPDKFIGTPKMRPDLFEKVYSYLEYKEQIEKDQDATSMSYLFLQEDTSRNTYLALDFNLSDGTIIPPGAEKVKIHISDDEYYIVQFEQVYKKISKYCETLFTTLPYNVLYIPDKNIRKIKKILTKTVFDRENRELNEVDFKSILDF